jgi:phage tail sheath protein FI
MGSPANLARQRVTAVSVRITIAEQRMLNVDVYGKSINAIRSFTGKGILVWGARTLVGSDIDLGEFKQTMITLGLNPILLRDLLKAGGTGHITV